MKEEKVEQMIRYARAPSVVLAQLFMKDKILSCLTGSMKQEREGRTLELDVQFREGDVVFIYYGMTEVAHICFKSNRVFVSAVATYKNQKCAENIR